MFGGASVLTTVRLLMSHSLEEVVRWSSSRGVYWSVVRAAYPTVFGGLGQDRERGVFGCTRIGGRTVEIVAVPRGYIILERQGLVSPHAFVHGPARAVSA